MQQRTTAAATSEAIAYDSWAPFYDATDADRAPFISFYGTLVSPATRSILELGCGTGTVLAALAQRLGQRPGDSSIVGVDGSVGMLAVARRKYPQLDFRLGDIRNPPVEDRFDLQVCAFNTFQHLLSDEDLRQALSAARTHAAPHGALAFDVYQPDAAYLATPHADRLARSSVDSEGRHLEIREDTAYDAASKLLTIRWRLHRTDLADPAPIAETSYRMRQFFPDEIDEHLAASGWAITHRYGDFDRSPFTATSRKQVLICSVR